MLLTQFPENKLLNARPSGFHGSLSLFLNKNFPASSYYMSHTPSVLLPLDIKPTQIFRKKKISMCVMLSSQPVHSLTYVQITVIQVFLVYVKSKKM